MVHLFSSFFMRRLSAMGLFRKAAHHHSRVHCYYVFKKSGMRNKEGMERIWTEFCANRQRLHRDTSR